MIHPQFILDLHGELIIDNFAGGGGASTGIEQALGRHVDHAINHNREALGMHRINHPQTVHHCEDVFDIDPVAVTEGRPVGLAWFSPDCKHFSKAKGGKPVDKRIRGLVLVMLRWAKLARPRVMIMENVEEIQTWGPLIKRGDGWYPDPAHKGRTWNAFLACLGAGIAPDHPDLPEILEVLDGSVTREDCVRGLGYQFDARELRACDYGAPTIRKRLFMVARCDGKPIVWPAPTHAPRHKIKPGRRALKPWRTVGECIDWSIPCPSIFLEGEAARKARCRRPLAPATLRRVAKGVGRYVLQAEAPFLVNLTHQGGERVESVDEPVRTITGAARGEKALVSPVVINTTNGKNDGAPSRTRSTQEPLPTITGSQKFARVDATLAPFITEHANASNQRNMPAGEPMRTLCAEVKGGHLALVAGTLVQTGYGERPGQHPRALDPNKPLGTIVAGGAKHAVICAHLTKFNTGSVGAALDEPAPTIMAGSHRPETRGGAATTQGIVCASIVREFGQSVGQAADQPAPTVMPGGGGKTGVLAAYIAQHNGGFNAVDGRPAAAPISTVSSRGAQQQLVAASLAAYYGSEQDGQGAHDPTRTITARGRHGLVESTLAAAYLTPEQLLGAQRVAAFLREHGVEFEGDFATVAGCIIVDLGMRMLTPRELFRAQGFPAGYIIDRAWNVDPHTGALTEHALTKEQQIRMCGNSVCPNAAAALVAANVPELRMASRLPKSQPVTACP